MSTILVISGSSRKDSFNTLLATNLAQLVADNGATPRLVDLKDFPLPIYNGDLEQSDGLPDSAKRLKSEMVTADGIIITCPEYNGFMTPLLINTIDWCTRSEDASGDLSAFSGNIALIASASPGPGGGARAATHLKTMLSGIGVLVLPANLAVASAHKAFDENRQFKDEGLTKRANSHVRHLVEVCGKLS